MLRREENSGSAGPQSRSKVGVERAESRTLRAFEQVCVDRRLSRFPAAESMSIHVKWDWQRRENAVNSRGIFQGDF